MGKNSDSKFILAMFLMNITSIACTVGAILLALNGVRGWGWFLACGILSIVTYERKSTKGDEDGEQVSID